MDVNLTENGGRVMGALKQEGGRLAPSTLYTRYDMAEPLRWPKEQLTDYRVKASALLNIDDGIGEVIAAGLAEWNDDEPIASKMLRLTESGRELVAA